MVIRAMLQPGGGRAIYQVRGVEVTKDQCLDVLDAFVQPKPDDVLGEAFEKSMADAGHYRDIYIRCDRLRDAVSELAQVVERVAKEVRR